MTDPVAFMALLSLFLSIGAIAFASRSVRQLSEQYTNFVSTHIAALKADAVKRGKDQQRMIESFASDVATNSKHGSETDREINELKQRMLDLIARLEYLEEDVTTRLPPRRVAKSPVLRSFAP